MNKKQLYPLDLYVTGTQNKVNSFAKYVEEIYDHITTSADSAAFSIAFQEIFNNKELFQLWNEGVEKYQSLLTDYAVRYNRGFDIPEAEVERFAALRDQGILRLRKALAPILEQRLADRISKMGNQGSTDRIQTSQRLHAKGLDLLAQYGLTPLMINILHKKYHSDTATILRDLVAKNEDKIKANPNLFDKYRLDAEDAAYFKMVENVMTHFKQQKQPITKDDAIYFANVLCVLDNLKKVQLRLQEAQVAIKDLGSKKFAKSILQTDSTTPRADVYLTELFKSLYSSKNPHVNEKERERIFALISKLKGSKKSPLTFRFEPLQPTAVKQVETDIEEVVTEELDDGLTR